ncbi:sodium-dependent nutrient amino acid transporter 1-like [Hyposmocoma kahamanoa]|uniref:sodium-dependent nutrient amino acid transporter 1-like n=1 Tax=Hyposmocoma kahamanoa TaxID=1477025 RepID=UPI000E6D6E43|nr:sodium-dependent nutrient amino acid transporter 1-like [Hyposmocoma kahamanoa]
MDHNQAAGKENGQIKGKGELNKGFDPSPEHLNDAGAESQARDGGNRQKWSNPTEFLMSCIATSVGLGNVWRFPYVAYHNGGGAFLIPYLIVLVLIGRPMYYLETFLGQFSSSNCVRIWGLSPAMKGTGYSQALGAFYVLSYYMSIIALCLYYLAMSFSSTLPWAECREGWENCVPSSGSGEPLENGVSSAQYYFINVVLRQTDGIEDGIGAPLWDLTLCLFISWLLVFVIVYRGVKSSGKAAYFLALFPYVVLFILLIRAVTLPGAGNGILFFITPEWKKILEVKVWYAAVTQVFFSLSVCSGALIMFASFNTFKQNVYRTAMIVTTLDTFTSLISGITIFAVLGNLGHELGQPDITKVINSGGTGLAFISYPDAIAKYPFVPQLFAVLFFLMMAVLGVGSGVALFSTINIIAVDALPNVKFIVVTAIGCVVGFLSGLVYVTPGGQYIFGLVDFYGGTFARLFAAIIETIGVFWIYGLENICVDIECALGRKTGIYWRLCWSILTPGIMFTVFMYAMVTTDIYKYGDEYEYPPAAYIAGNMLQYAAMVVVPIVIIVVLFQHRSNGFLETVRCAFRKSSTYGPSIQTDFDEWKSFRRDAKIERKNRTTNHFKHMLLSVIGSYRNKRI